MIEAVGAICLAFIVGRMVIDFLEAGDDIRRDRERSRLEKEQIERRDEALRQAEEDKARRRAADPVIERYWAGVERRSRLLRR